MFILFRSSIFSHLLIKAEHILGAIDQEHAKLISGSEDELEVEALARITDDTRWKINLYR